MPSFPTSELPALLLATSFAAGLNVYATVATLGLLSRAQVVALPPALHPVASWYVIGACLALFLVEFVADKIPAFDLVWNALHTFVRIPIAALLAWGATAQLSPGMQVLAAVLGGGIALAAHSGKMAARLAVTPSPEPLSNIGLSLGEDAVSVSLTWLATQHPYVAATIVIVALLLVVFMIRFVIRAMRSLFRGAERQVSSASGSVA
ncbi:MAG TPA: DUF4126 domain-containing protein [Terriglobales bacterium]|jgi:hypothetical protein|nr:DUF4126 domain-containing protein [Terriglobales bacterium]